MTDVSAVGKDLHIDAPHLLSRRRRITDTVATAMMWILYSYLWAPFISLVAWLLGFEFAYDVMVRAGGANGLLEILMYYGIVLICIVVLVTSWSWINRYRFSGHDRRQSGHETTDHEIAEYFDLDAEDLQKIRGSLIAKVTVSSSGRIEHIHVLKNDGDSLNIS